MERPSLSVVVPVYNEAGNIKAVLDEATAKLKRSFELEVIVVDDGSDDRSPAVVSEMAAADPGVRLIRHPVRAGKSAALRTGVLAARCRWVATMDGDGQNDPDDIANMAKLVDLGRVGAIGLVAGIRRRRNDGTSRLAATRFANGLRRRLLHDDCTDTACGLKLVARDVFLALPFFDALHRFLPALVRRLGFETRYVDVDDRPRRSGTSKYTNVQRAAVGIVDLFGVLWLMRRTTVPARELVLVPAERGMVRGDTPTGKAPASSGSEMPAALADADVP